MGISDAKRHGRYSSFSIRLFSAGFFEYFWKLLLNLINWMHIWADILLFSMKSQLKKTKIEFNNIKV